MEALNPTESPTNEEKVPIKESEANENETVNVNDKNINANDDIINVNDDNININDSDTKLTDFHIDNTKDSEIENVEAIKKYIAQQEREIEELKAEQLKSKLPIAKEDTAISLNPEQSLSMSSSVIDNMMIESELDTAKKEEKPKALLSSVDKGSIALSVGSKVEAMDFCGDWYRADIIEVDFEEMEVLVHYETDVKRLDEWISVSSTRLRPEGTAPTVKPGPSSAESLSDTIPISAIKEEIKEQKERTEEKARLTYAVGERCLARWRDNRRFVATVLKDVGDDNYEIVFDDGCHWKCKASRLYKMKPDKGVVSDASQTALGPSNAPLTAYHTHLFDPTRDYLGSKSERRERKRKLNIKEIFNIGQKKQKAQRKVKPKVKNVKVEVKQELSGAVDAVASIIGSVNIEQQKVTKIEIKSEPDVNLNDDNNSIDENTEIIEVPMTTCDSEDEVESKMDLDTVLEEESKLEKFEKPENHHEEVIDRIKEAIIKLEDGLHQAERMNSPKLEKMEVPAQVIEEKSNVEEKDTKEIKDTEEDKSIEKIEETPVEIVDLKAEMEKIEVTNKNIEDTKPAETTEVDTKADTKVDNMKDLSIVLEKMKEDQPEKDTKKLTKIKKSKKLRLIREKKVKKQVAKVKSELEAMKRQVEEMRKQMLMKSEGEAGMMPESFLLPGEWCCKWMNGQPVGKVSEIEADGKPDPVTGKVPLPRRSVEVEDKRLPEGWTKHMVRRSLGHSAGKWDVVLISPDNKRFHTKHEMRIYLENNPHLHPYETGLLDFGIHLKLARRMGWITRTSDGETIGPTSPLPVGTLCSTSPLVKRKSLGLKKNAIVKKRKIKKKKMRMGMEEIAEQTFPMDTEIDINAPPLEDGYVYCGSLKVQIIETLLRCPAEGCLKNFRNTTLLQMHIKHYHRELHKMMGATPKVLDLAYARTKVARPSTDTPKSDKTFKVKISRPKTQEPKPAEVKTETELSAPTKDVRLIPRSQDSPKLRKVLNKPIKRPKVLLPVARADPNQIIPDLEEFEESETCDAPMESLDFETAISTHTVTKPIFDKKKNKCFANVVSEEEEWTGISSDVDTRSSFPGSGTPDSKIDVKPGPVPAEFTEEKDNYTLTESGERIKIVHMKREEIINCHCGFREEDGLMVQCELCLCWQHALCHNIQKEGDVPEKYTCSICLNPRRGRRSKRFVHDQDRLYEGLLPAARPCEALRRSHELAANLLRLEDAARALRLKYYVATKKDHPKLYLWAKDWEQVEIQYTQEKLNSDYSDLNIMINSIGKENLPLKSDDVMDIRTPPSEELEQDRYTHREGPLGSQALLSSIMSSPGGVSLDLPISTSELERLAKSVQEQELERQVIMAPQPEAAIEDSACRERLLRHVTRCQALIDARLDSIEAQVAELESQDPSLQDDETADFYPRTKQTIQMLLRDLDTMEELGVIT